MTPYFFFYFISGFKKKKQNSIKQYQLHYQLFIMCYTYDLFPISAFTIVTKSYTNIVVIDL